VQELADHLRVHRNTVAAAYAALQEEGYLVSRRGAGTFVADSETTRAAVHRAALRDVVDQALARAVEMGFTPAEFAEAAAARARMHEAQQGQRRLLFVECNVPEIEQHSRTLTRELGVAVEGVHLDDVRRDPAAFRRRTAAAEASVSAGAERAFGGDRRRRCGVTHWSVLAELAAQRMSQELRDAEAARRVREPQGGGRERRVRPRPPWPRSWGTRLLGGALRLGGRAWGTVREAAYALARGVR
jgi:DNA-binding GntR family transcriptional regulator